jgi:hypothetical protein
MNIREIFQISSVIVAFLVSIFFASVGLSETRSVLNIVHIKGPHSLDRRDVVKMNSKIRKFFREEFDLVLTIKTLTIIHNEFYIPFGGQLYNYLKAFDSYRTKNPSGLFHAITPPMVWDSRVGGPKTHYLYLSGVSKPEIYFVNNVKIINHCLFNRGGMSISSGAKKRLGVVKDNLLDASFLVLLHEVLHQLGAWHDPASTKFIMSQDLYKHIELDPRKTLPVKISKLTRKDVKKCVKGAFK